MDLAVFPRPVARKAKIGEHMEAGTARFFAPYLLFCQVVFLNIPHKADVNRIDL